MGQAEGYGPPYPRGAGRAGQCWVPPRAARSSLWTRGPARPARPAAHSQNSTSRYLCAASASAKLLFFSTRTLSSSSRASAPTLAAQTRARHSKARLSMSDVGSGRGGRVSAAGTAKATRARVGPDLAFINPGSGTRPRLPLAVRVSRRAHAPGSAPRLAEELRGPPSACEDWTPTQGWATKWEKARRLFSSCLGLATVRARAHKHYVPQRLIRWRRRTFSFWTSDWRLFPRLPHVSNGRCFPLSGRVASDWLRDARTQPDSPSNVAVGGVPSPWAELRLRLRSPSCCILTGPRFRTGTASTSRRQEVRGCHFRCACGSCSPCPGPGLCAPRFRGLRFSLLRQLSRVYGRRGCSQPSSLAAGTFLGLPFSTLGCPRLLSTGMRGPRPAEAHLGKWRKLYVVHFLLTTC